MKKRLLLTTFALFLFSNQVLVLGQVSKVQWGLPTIDDEKNQVSYLSGTASFNKIPTEITGLEVTGIMPIKCVMRRDYGQINVYFLYESPVRIYEIHYKGQDFITKQFQEILPTSVSKINYDLRVSSAYQGGVKDINIKSCADNARSGENIWSSGCFASIDKLFPVITNDKEWYKSAIMFEGEITEISWSDLNEVRKKLDQLIGQQQSNLLVDEGKKMQQASDLNGAKDKYQAAIKLNAQNSEALVLLEAVNTDLKQKQFSDEQIKKAEQAYKQGNIDLAISYFMEASKLDPSKKEMADKQIAILKSIMAAPQDQSFNMNIISNNIAQLKIIKNDIPKYEKASKVFKDSCRICIEKLESELVVIEKEKQASLKDYRQGFYCSECGRSKTQIEKELTVSFQQHLVDVKGRSIPFTDMQLQEKSIEYENKKKTLQKNTKDLCSKSKETDYKLSNTLFIKENLTNEINKELYKWKYITRDRLEKLKQKIEIEVDMDEIERSKIVDQILEKVKIINAISTGSSIDILLSDLKLKYLDLINFDKSIFDNNNRRIAYASDEVNKIRFEAERIQKTLNQDYLFTYNPAATLLPAESHTESLKRCIEGEALVYEKLGANINFVSIILNSINETNSINRKDLQLVKIRQDINILKIQLGWQ